MIRSRKDPWPGEIVRSRSIKRFLVRRPPGCALPCGWWRGGRRGGGGTAAGWPRAEGAPPRTWSPTLPSTALLFLIIISIIELSIDIMLTRIYPMGPDPLLMLKMLFGPNRDIAVLERCLHICSGQVIIVTCEWFCKTRCIVAGHVSRVCDHRATR